MKFIKLMAMSVYFIFVVAIDLLFMFLGMAHRAAKEGYYSGYYVEPEFDIFTSHKRKELQ